MQELAICDIPDEDFARARRESSGGGEKLTVRREREGADVAGVTG